MDKNDEYAVVANAVSTLAIIMCADEKRIISLLHGYLWTAKEVSGILAELGKLNFERIAERINHV